jgi:cell division septation protein DedD
LATQVHDDGFHEIQLNGKQLVFLFMAATVVSVVIFLCGVLVGRGVRSDRSVSSTDSTAGSVMTDTSPQPAATTPAVPAGSDPTSATPPATVDDSNLSYFNRLEKSNTTENLKPVPAAERSAAETPAKSARATPAPPPVAAPKPVAAAPAASAPAPPATPTLRKEEAAAVPSSGAPADRDGFAIQVAALREPGEADTIAKRLVSKGYGAYVLTPPDGRPNVYRVRIGTFKTRREAEAIASKLQKEEQFKPWITR